MSVEFHLGIDDTDSPKGGCTTYTMALIVDELKTAGFGICDYPCLVRLNPNVPWKTRGNAALALHLQIPEFKIAEAKKIVCKVVKDNSTVSEAKTDPAIVFLQGPVPDNLREFYKETLTDIVPVEEAFEVASATGVEWRLLKGTRGLVGALASIGADLDQDDHTYEAIAYRTRDYLGTRRNVDADSVRRMNEKFQDRTFNNLDPETGRILVAPHGPDPVLFGVRGRDDQSALAALEMVRVNESIERVQIFRTNQGTDAHLQRPRNVTTLEPYQSGNITGEVASIPVSWRGGHVFFQLAEYKERVECAAFEPTGPFRHTILQLLPGDRVRVYGGVRPGRRNTKWMLNLEKLEVLSLVNTVESRLPRCNECGGTFESMGKGQGYRCRKCGLKTSLASTDRMIIRKERGVTTGTYLPPPRANRHLTKPLAREGAQLNSSLA